MKLSEHELSPNCSQVTKFQENASQYMGNSTFLLDLSFPMTKSKPFPRHKSAQNLCIP